MLFESLSEECMARCAARLADKKRDIRAGDGTPALCDSDASNSYHLSNNEVKTIDATLSFGNHQTHNVLINAVSVRILQWMIIKPHGHGKMF